MIVLTCFLQDSHSGVVHQAWLDAVQSLILKYNLDLQFELRGSGMWEADSVDHYNSRDDGISQTNVGCTSSQWMSFEFWACL